MTSKWMSNMARHKNSTKWIKGVSMQAHKLYIAAGIAVALGISGFLNEPAQAAGAIAERIAYQGYIKSNTSALSGTYNMRVTLNSPNGTGTTTYQQVFSS